ncbi:13654_t:CDS:2, partial [Racocetra persica]
LQTLNKVRKSQVNHVVKSADQYSHRALERHAKRFAIIDDLVQKRAKILNIVNIIDSNYISHDAYKNLAAINDYLPREHIIASEQNNLTQEMSKDISIKLININTMMIDEYPKHIDEEFDNIDNESNNLAPNNIIDFINI